jgi:hypothetical protein
MSRRFQFSLRALLVTLAVAAIGFLVGGVQIAVALALVSYGLLAWSVGGR